MKIFHYIRSIRREDGGVVRAVLDHCNILAKASHQVTLASVHPIDIPKAWRNQINNIPETVDLSGCLVWNMFFTGRGRKLLEKEIGKADIVYLHEIWRPENAQLARIARRFNKPYLVPIYGMLSEWAMGEKRFKKRAYYALAGRHFLEGARFLQCVNEQEQNQASCTVPKGKWVIMPYLIDTSVYGSRYEHDSSDEFLKQRNHEKMFLFLSRFHPKKGIELLIDATLILKQRGHRFKVLLCGAGEPRYVEKLRIQVEHSELDGNITFIGPQFGLEKIALYDTADALVLPTRSENFGIVLIEAMGCGLPVITTNKVDIWKNIQKGGARIIDLDVDQLANEMERIIEMSSGDRLSLGSREKEWVFENFDLTRLVYMYQDMHKEALNPPFEGQLIDYSDRFYQS